jgi:hypothetical protein
MQTVSLGAYCESPGRSYDGQFCEYEHATCGGYAQDCHGRSVKSAPHACVVCLLFAFLNAQGARLPHLGLRFQLLDWGCPI